MDSHLASTTFCWLPPDSVDTGSVEPRRLDLQPLASRSRADAPLGAAEQQAEPAERPAPGQRGVALDRQLHHQALLAPVLGHQREPGGDRGRGRAGRRAAGRRPAPRRASYRSTPNTARITSLRPGADQPGQRDDLAAADGEARRRRRRRAGSARAPRGSTSPTSASLLRVERGDLAADHPADDLVDGERPRSRSVDDPPPVAHHRDPLAEREDLVEAVRDEQHRGAARRAATGPPRTAARPPRRTARRSARPSPARARRSDSALAISTSCWSAMDSPRAGRSGSRCTPSRANSSTVRRAHRGRVDAAQAAQRLPAHEDVLGDRQVGEQRRLLVDHRDPGRPGVGRAAEGAAAAPSSSHACPRPAGARRPGS